MILEVSDQVFVDQTSQIIIQYLKKYHPTAPSSEFVFNSSKETSLLGSSTFT